ncbi:MAG: hypothetical protein HKN26_12740 [Acidimicrobiales bacterium]|nr:hypothetical protein [Acidimicrobiales bacterium]
MAVFEGVIYNARLLDDGAPDRLTLTVDAVLRPGDADEGPLLMPVPELIVLIGKPAADRLLPKYRAEGRIISHQGVAHLSFPFWEPG